MHDFEWSVVVMWFNLKLIFFRELKLFINFAFFSLAKSVVFNGGDECEPGLVMQANESLTYILNYSLEEVD